MANSSPILTIIIPVFNLQDYIARTLDSIYDQDVSEELFEVVVVDDGSSDKSPEILKEYSKKHDNFHVYTNTNHGVSYSRNFAINKAIGEYITFLDGDDLFLPQSIHSTINYLNKFSTDVLYELTFFIKDRLIPSHTTPKGVRLGTYYTISQLGDFCNGAGSVWGGVYNRSFLLDNNLYFPEGIANGEDTIYNYLLYIKNPRIVFSDVALYAVTIREGSASRNKTIERAAKCVRNIRFLNTKLKESKLDASQTEFIHKAMWTSIGNAVEMYANCGFFDSGTIKSELEISTVPRLQIIHTSFQQRVKVFIFNTSFSLYIKLYQLKSILKNQIKF